MATKSIKRQVLDIHPNAEYVGMGMTGFMIHTIYKDKGWKISDIIGQSASGQKEAWINALNNIKQPVK